MSASQICSKKILVHLCIKYNGPQGCVCLQTQINLLPAQLGATMDLKTKQRKQANVGFFQLSLPKEKL